MALRILLTGLLVCLWAPAFGEPKIAEEGQFYITPGAILFEGSDASEIGFDDQDLGGGAILGFSVTDRWAVEFLLGRVDSDFTNDFGSGEGDIDLAWVDALYKFKSDSDNFQPFLVFGAGRADYEFDNVRSDAKDNQINIGLGAWLAMSEHFAVRADIRGVTSNKSSGLSPMAFIGLTGFIGEGSEPLPPPDSDGDGVPNDQDQCPTTPPGRVVDEKGCQLDSDGDGVVDAEDQCPNTPAGAPVDQRGCPLDSDGDGVPDYKDECPDSAAGAKVDEKGCYIELEETVTIDLNLEFETNAANIIPSHYSELNRVVEFLRQYPTANAVIEGHTDSDGSAAYNQGLSERRAKAVYDYLITAAGVAEERLTHAGFGESRPIADNGTAEGKQRNRRVSAVVQGTHTVRQ